MHDRGSSQHMVDELLSDAAQLVRGKPPGAESATAWLARLDALPILRYPQYDERMRGWSGPVDIDRLLAPRLLHRQRSDVAARQHLWSVLRLSHANGFHREHAVGETPFSRGTVAMLLVRAADWVTAVRAAAVARLELVPDEQLFEVLPLAFRLSQRGHGETLGLHLQARATEPFLRRAILHSDQMTRRSAWGMLAARNEITDTDTLALAADADQVNRRLATARLPTLPAELRRAIAASLLHDPVGGIAVAALRTLFELDGDAPVREALDSRNPAARKSAQRLATTCGLDVREHYRKQLRADPCARTSLLGLAESARPEDLPDLVHLLADPNARVRAGALRSIGWYDVTAARRAAVAELNRPHGSRAKRAAARILAADRIADDEARVLETLALNARSETRDRALALRLTRSRRWLNLSLALQLMVDRTPAARALGSAELDRWLREATVIAGRPTEAERETIDRLLPRLDSVRRARLSFVMSGT